MLDRRLIGKTYPRHPVTATADQVARFAAAIGDESPDYAAGRRVPPTFGAVYAFRALRQVLRDPELGADVPGRVHGEQQFRFRRHPRCGESLTAQARVEDVYDRGRLQFLVVRVDIVDADGADVMDVRSTLVIRKSE
jgi:acyl dehydratase